MEIQSLPVYNKTRQLYIQIQASTQKAPRNIRVNQLSVIENMLIDIMEHIAFANAALENPGERYRFISNAIGILHRVEIRVRILFDLNYIKKQGFNAIIKLESEVARQLNGWAQKNK